MKKKAKVIGFLLLVVVFIIGLNVKMGKDSEAADSMGISIIYGNNVADESIEMLSNILSMGCRYNGSETGNYTTRWSITSGEDVVGFQESKAVGTIVDSTTAANPYLRAKKVGTAVIKVEVLSGSIVLDWKECTVNVRLAIDTTDNYSYEYIHDTDTRRSLIMYVAGKGEDNPNEQLKLSVGSATDAKWSSDNTDVVSVGETTGIVTRVGAGKANIRVITAEGEDSIDVYVIPKIANSADGKYKTNQTYNIRSGDILYTDVKFDSNRTLTIKDKISWAIYRLDNKNNKYFIKDSLGNEGEDADIIELLPIGGDIPKNLKVNAKSGEYYVDFYPAGIYNGQKDICEKVPANTIKLNVSKALPNSQINLNVGDSYSLADAFNISVDEFNTWFWEPVISDPNTISYASSNGEITANAMSTDSITVTVKPKHDYMNKIAALYGTIITEEQGFTFTIKTVDVLTLDQTSVRLVEGESRQLTPTTTTYDGQYTWSSSNESFVSVTQSGMIKGIKTTTDDVTITVSLKLSNGSIKKATCKVKVVPTANAIKLNKEEVILNVGEQENIIVSFDPDRSEAPIKWAISDETIAKIRVDETAKSVVVTALNPGTTTLVALNSDNYVTAFCKIKVLQPVTSISLDQTQLTVKLNREVVRLNATLQPANTTSTDLEWMSSDTSVASVDKTGLVTLHSAGTVLITVKPKVNITPPIMAQCTLTVVQSSTSLKFQKTEMSLEVGGKEDIEYTLLPQNSTTVITWNSLDKKIASVNNTGEVTAVGVGKTYITAVTEEGYVATCMVTVTQQATGVVLDVTDLTLDVGDTYKVNYALKPENSTDAGLTWTSQDEKVASVASDGRITGVKPGKTTIFVKTKSGNVEYIFVTVRQSVKGVTLSKTDVKLNKGETITLTATLTPAGVTNSKISWRSSNEKVVTVSQSGKLKGISGGAAVVTCTTDDGKHEANCIVTVTETATSVKLNRSSYTLGVGKTVTLKATVRPDSVSSKKVKWTSTNTKIAKVNSSGKVTGKKVGTCTIKAKATDGSGEFAVCKIKVVRQATSVKLNKMYVKMYTGASYKLKAVIKPKNVTKKSLSWSSSNSDVVLVGRTGKIKALSAGRATITVQTKDNSKKKAQCVIDVIERVPVTTITASEDSLVMVKGTAKNLGFTVSPANTTDKISYSSDNRFVATVNKNGRVKAVRPGVATITAKSTSGKIAMVVVTVVGLNKTSVTLEQYSTDQLWIEDDTGLNVRWSSEDAGIVRVDNAGNITARKVGTTRIIANIGAVKLYCTVRVVKIPNTK